MADQFIPPTAGFTTAAQITDPPRQGTSDLARSVIARDYSEAYLQETSNPVDNADEQALPASEQTPLLSNGKFKSQQHDNSQDLENPDGGLLEFRPGTETTWPHEAKLIGKYTAFLIPTFLLQHSLMLSTMVSVGHLGTIELGAVSLGVMSANITGFAVCSGMTTSLDTLCAQAYGSGKKTLVGLQVLRMVIFLALVSIAIGVLWLFAPYILAQLVPEPEVAELAGRYLRIAWFALPGFGTYAAGKRFLQAQGNFSASLYILMVVAPMNAFLNWLFVWHLGWGFDGAPIAVAISTHSLWISQVVYVYFVGGRECWPGFTRQALHGWGPMIRLSVPGFVMVEAEVLAFEILTLLSSYFGPVALASNSVLFSIINLAFQVAFPMSTAVSTRIAHLIGSRSPDAAKVSASVGIVLAVVIGLFNVALLSGLRNYVPLLYSDDPKVWHLVGKVLPLCTVFLLFDSTATSCNGILRGLGRQSIGSYVQLLCYYVVGLPISIGTAFGAGFELYGLWGGLMVALLCVTTIELLFITKSNWQRSVDDAVRRNEQS